ncbi:hypothetical protein M4L90_02720 [Staphylococcus equorum]|uniref:Uncharacterized protein n=1 Tax=Staphylococcus equorum TaxID=246432 RepID=A0A9X4L2I4_9STAP|nr:hypothetical protein [Staphylococcus equorum]MDG0818802.1 hypothetical protein [Staphylococcus equorum]MDG0839443.1 hypothetical protein [Staphylococcus equorum]MDG0844831.1 hypothetical protein [Staphylococcus equorum]
MNIDLVKELTEEQKALMKHNSVTNKMFNKRINQGWSLEETISLPRTFKMANDGLIYKQLNVKGNLYHLSSEQYLHLVEIGVDLNRIYTRIAKGEPFEVAIKRKVSENLEDFEERLFIEEYNENKKQNVSKAKELRKILKKTKLKK